MSFMEQLKDGLSKTRKNFTERMEDLVGASVELDEDFMDEMEMILVAGDVGIKTTERSWPPCGRLLLPGRSNRRRKPCPS